jgi:hypothetical protein
MSMGVILSKKYRKNPKTCTYVPKVCWGKKNAFLAKLILNPPSLKTYCAAWLVTDCFQQHIKAMPQKS